MHYAYQEDEWVPELQETLSLISADQAKWKPSPEAKCIWEICLHVAVWNDNIIERIETGSKARPIEGNWPPLPSSLSKEAWNRARVEVVDSANRLYEYLQEVPIEKIEASPWGIADLTCRFLHIAYHTGQIVKMIEMAGWSSGCQ